ncbi:MAG: hypothetical protein BGO68_01425 [Candidatus Amoebophilus sp. 36-38]|nr:MAG: hypothetical protein BGO68_01425 [Candidatus Amoebophilus sp. 36-38]
MSFWSTLPFVRITIIFIGGILWAYYQPLSADIIGLCMAITVSCYLVLVIILIRTRLHILNPWVGVIGLVSVFLAGALCLLKYKNECNLPLSSIKAYVAVALEDAIKREDRLSVTVSIQKVKVDNRWLDLTDQVRLHITHPSTNTIAYGDIYIILGAPQFIDAPLNPNEFDYKTFLSHENIYYQHRVAPSAIQKIEYVPPNHIQAFFLKASRMCKEILIQHIPSNRERSIILALVLGIKDELDYVMRDAYAGSGTMHVLAVSGLHVGILYWLLSLLLYRLNKSKQTRWFGSLLVLIGLWMYAGITGFAPSVLRATLMFSLLVVGRLLRRTGNIYNILAASAFVLLIFKPTLIFSVSFQLSYLAVWGILYLQPKIYRWLQLNNLILRQLWLWTSVSLAAQLVTTSINLYYFHRFPSYFIFANWVVVPAAFLIFTLGLGVLFTCWWTGLSVLIAWVLEWITWLVNQFVGWVNGLPYSVIENMYLPAPRLFLWYGLLIILLVFLERKKFRLLLLASGCALLLSLSAIQEILQRHSHQGVIFYSIPSHQVVGFFKGSHHVLLVDEQFRKEDKKFNYHIQPSQLAMGIHTNEQCTFIEAVKLPEMPIRNWEDMRVGVWGKKMFVFIDKPVTHWPLINKKLQVDFLVIERNGVSSLRSLVEHFECKTLIIGTSNTKRRAEQLEMEAKELHLKIHVLYKQGALKVCWEN